MATRNGPDPLPPLEWLRVFEAAGRLGNFTAAADELGLTQAAVSQRIRNLESRLGTRLFDRLPRGVEMTADGEAYLPHVHAALAALRRGTVDLFGAPRRKITIAAPASVTSFWIAPRLAALIKQRPNLHVSITTVHRPADFAAADADLEVRFGDGEWPGQRALRLYNEVIGPVCAPALLTGTQEDWRRLPLIAVSGPRYGWSEWAAAYGTAPPAPPVLRFDSMAPALHAAIGGAGVLLASLPLATAEIRAGRLVRLREPALNMRAGYWMIWSDAAQIGPRDNVVTSALTEEPSPTD